MSRIEEEDRASKILQQLTFLEEHTASWEHRRRASGLPLVKGGETSMIGSFSQGLDITRRVIAATCINGLGHEHLTGSAPSPTGWPCGTERGGSEAY